MARPWQAVRQPARDWYRHHCPDVDEPAPSFITTSYIMLVEADARS